MRYFLIEGIVINPKKMTDKLMSDHQNYTGRLMREGKVLFSSLKKDMSASITVVKEKSLLKVQDFYNDEPFFKNEIVTYKISELDIHYNAYATKEWFIDNK